MYFFAISHYYNELIQRGSFLWLFFFSVIILLNDIEKKTLLDGSH